MITVLTFGGYAIVGATAVVILKKKHRSDLAWTAELLLKLGLISAVGLFVIRIGRDIISAFGGIPL